jgi:hypothetical protein
VKFGSSSTNRIAGIDPTIAIEVCNLNPHPQASGLINW